MLTILGMVEGWSIDKANTVGLCSPRLGSADSPAVNIWGKELLLQ